MQNCFRNVYENIVIKRQLENVHYVQTVKNVHTYRLYPGKMRGPACDPAVHDDDDDAAAAAAAAADDDDDDDPCKRALTGPEPGQCQ